ncbi:MAG TPA: HD domain-containing phosphohydrolase [Gemmatimonadaceae bacterium]|nr:HD domain-containing phosphohydrolase [Gemmatimonadaceae bacterium]
MSASTPAWGTVIGVPAYRPDEILAAADARRAAGDRAGAVELYENALHALGRKATPLAATILRRIGRSYWELGQLDAAVDVLQLGLLCAEAAGDGACAAHILNVLAVCHWQRGQLDDAERLYATARTTAVAAGENLLVAMIDQNLGIILSVRGDLTGALRHYQRSLHGYRAAGHRQNLGRLLNNMGMLYAALERWRDAERAYAEAAAACADVGDREAQLMVEVNHTQLWVARGELTRARAACDAILGAGEDNVPARALSETLKHRGVVARESGELTDAERMLTRALSLARGLEDPLLQAETLRELAELACRTDRSRDMLRFLSQAHHIFDQLRARRDVADVGRRAQRLEERFHDVVRRWSGSIESKDPYTQGHCERVTEYATALAADCGFDALAMFWFRVGALLHDVGKIAVPTSILTKPGPLTLEERGIMERHALAGAELLADVDFPWDVLPIIRNHHERWDGTGYPDRLAGEQIPLAARILGIADIYDALTTDRPYRAAYSTTEALAIMDDMSGTALDPKLYRTFRSLVASIGATPRIIAVA